MLERNSILDFELIGLKSTNNDAELELRRIKSIWKKHDALVIACLNQVMNNFAKLQVNVNSATVEKYELKEQIKALQKQVEKLCHLNQM